MPIYSFHCQTCSEFYDELCKLGEHSEKCPECGESRKTKLVKQLTMPQTPKVHSSDTKAQDRWGYNKTTTETNINIIVCSYYTNCISLSHCRLKRF